MMMQTTIGLFCPCVSIYTAADKDTSSMAGFIIASSRGIARLVIGRSRGYSIRARAEYQFVYTVAEWNSEEFLSCCCCRAGYETRRKREEYSSLEKRFLHIYALLYFTNKSIR